MSQPSAYSKIDELKQAMNRLPRISDGLPGIGGTIKVLPEHFQVVETLPYAPCGEGEHVYVTLQRAGWNTVDVARTLARTFQLKPLDVGWGGRKDKQALTTQTFSLLLPMHLNQTQIETMLSDLPFKILKVTRHRNKIKTGHVAGNHFNILVSTVTAEALERTHSIVERLNNTGIPNYFGPQRFGHNMGNLDRVGALLTSKKNIKGKQNAFWVSSLQAALFNLWLLERIQRGDWDKILDGDVAKKTDTGGLFVVDDPVEAGERLRRGAVVYTGPNYGHKMMPAAAKAGEHETALRDRYELTPAILKRLRAPGTRRPAILQVTDLIVENTAEGIRFSFSLPSGAYATTVLREFMHQPPEENAQDQK